MGVVCVVCVVCVLVYLENPQKYSFRNSFIKSTASAVEFQSSPRSCRGSWPSLPERVG